MIYLNGEKVVPTLFPDKTSQVWKINKFKNYEYDDVTISNVIEWKFENESELIHVAQLADLIHAHGAYVDLYLPYLPYGRQDKSVSNETTFALKTFATLLNAMNFKTVRILDPHSTVALIMIQRSFAVYPTEDISKVFNRIGIDCICYPDKGALRKYYDIYSGIDEVFKSPITGNKSRDQKTGWIKDYCVDGDTENKNILIIDDICDGGATFNLLAQKIKERSNPKSINLFVSHGIFSNGLKELKKNIDRIFIPGYEVDVFGDKFIYKLIKENK